MDRLPPELLDPIISLLEDADLHAFALVNSRTNKIARTRFTWRVFGLEECIEFGAILTRNDKDRPATSIRPSSIRRLEFDPTPPGLRPLFVIRGTKPGPFVCRTFVTLLGLFSDLRELRVTSRTQPGSFMIDREDEELLRNAIGRFDRLVSLKLEYHHTDLDLLRLAISPLPQLETLQFDLAYQFLVPTKRLENPLTSLYLLATESNLSQCTALVKTLFLPSLRRVEMSFIDHSADLTLLHISKLYLELPTACICSFVLRTMKRDFRPQQPFELIHSTSTTALFAYGTQSFNEWSTLHTICLHYGSWSGIKEAGIKGTFFDGDAPWVLRMRKGTGTSAEEVEEIKELAEHTGKDFDWF